MRSEAAASSQSGEKPKAKIEPTSTTLPAAFRFASSPASGPGSTVGEPSTPPTSSTMTRSRFLAVTSYSRDCRTNLGSVSSNVSCSVPPSPAAPARTVRSGTDAKYRQRFRLPGTRLMVAASDPRRLPVLKGIEADCESDEEPTVDVGEVRS